MMKEPNDFTEGGGGLRAFSLNSDYAHWLTLADQEESMLPRVRKSESLMAANMACRQVWEIKIRIGASFSTEFQG